MNKTKSLFLSFLILLLSSTLTIATEISDVLPKDFNIISFELKAHIKDENHYNQELWKDVLSFVEGWNKQTSFSECLKLFGERMPKLNELQQRIGEDKSINGTMSISLGVCEDEELSKKREALKPHHAAFRVSIDRDSCNETVWQNEVHRTQSLINYCQETHDESFDFNYVLQEMYLILESSIE